MIAIGINVLTGLALGTVLVPSLLPGGAWRGLVLVTTLTVAIVALSPPVLTRLVNGAFRILKQPLLDRGLSWGGMFSASGFSLASWLCYGLSVWGLAIAVGGDPWEVLPLSLAGVAVAMTVGVLVIVAPSGSASERRSSSLHSPSPDRADALAVALVARLLFTLADLSRRSRHAVAHQPRATPVDESGTTASAGASRVVAPGVRRVGRLGICRKGPLDPGTGPALVAAERAPRRITQPDMVRADVARSPYS